MKLNNFNGGLSTRLDPTLVPANEAVLYSNIDNSKGSLTSIKDYLLTSTDISRWFYLFNDIWYSSTNDREYLEYKKKLYWTEQENLPKKVVNNVIKPLGINAPIAALTTVDGGAGSISTSAETLQYMYTYYDSSEGIESAPSPLSTELNLGANKQVDISNIVPSTNPFVDKIRLYRIGADATDFTLLIELDNSITTYTDNIATINAIGTILDTYNNQPPIVGLRYLVEAYGIIFAAKEDGVYYSRIGLPDYWPSSNFISIADTVTGLAVIPDGIVIFTSTKAYLLVGTSSANFRLVNLNTEHGCLNHNSIKTVKNSLLWVSADGLCSLYGSVVTVLTKEKLDRQTFNVINSVIYSEQYMLVLADGTIFIADLRFNKAVVFKTINYLQTDVYNLGVFDNVLYAVINNKVANLDAGQYIDFYYKSPRLTEGDASVTKLYNNIYVNIEGNFIITVYIDGQVVSVNNLNYSGVQELKVPAEKQRGSDIQFEVQGAGILREIEYKVIGRENGR